jgi:hypothetical protein
MSTQEIQADSKAAEAERQIDVEGLAPLADRIMAGIAYLDRALEALENNLNGLDLKLEVWLDDTDERWQLGYGHDGNARALLVRAKERVRTRPASWDWCSYRLLDCGTDRRIEAISLIPRLIEKLRAEASTAVERLDQATKITKSLAS